MLDATVVIDCFVTGATRHRDDHTIVAIDVIRATTLAVTAVATGRRCLVATDLEDAAALRDRLAEGILAGELGGHMPDGFDMNNSPSDLTARADITVPLIMLSTSGTGLMLAAGTSAHGGYVACLRNLRAVARHVIGRHQQVALIGAGSRGEFREEDQLGCAWLAAALIDAGYRAEDAATVEIVDRWRDASVEAIETGNSVGYLRRTDQMRDYEFTTSHVDDLDVVCVIEGNEVLVVAGTA